MTRKPKKNFSAFLWHRRVGLVAIILVVILAITGIMLNHTERLQLDSRYVSNSLLLSWYGIEPEGEPVSYQAGDHVITAWDNRLFFDGRIVTSLQQQVHGAMAGEQFIVVALDSAIILLTPGGEFIEQVSTSISFTNIQRLGMKYDRPVIETSDPLYYIADEHILDWDVITPEGIVWSQAHDLTGQEREALLTSYRGKGLELERVILDLHSGRIFGEYGVYLMDAAAIALLWLSFSGLWVWSSRRRKMRHKRHYQKHHRN